MMKAETMPHGSAGLRTRRSFVPTRVRSLAFPRRGIFTMEGHEEHEGIAL